MTRSPAFVDAQHHAGSCTEDYARWLIFGLSSIPPDLLDEIDEGPEFCRDMTPAGVIQA